MDILGVCASISSVLCCFIDYYDSSRLLFQRVLGAPTTATMLAAIFAHFLKCWLLPWRMGTCAWERVRLALCIMGVLGWMLNVLTGHCLQADNWIDPRLIYVWKPLSWGG